MSSDNKNNNNSNINIWITAGDGDIDRVKEILNTGISPDIQDQNGYTPLAAAVSYNRIELVEFLLTCGANVNLCDNDGDSPLFLAETVEMVQKLLDNGADPYIANIEGKTPAQVIFEEGWLDVAEFLRSITGESIPEIDNDLNDSIFSVNLLNGRDLDDNIDRNGH
ncbi:hypothetical protein Glove_186g137 [Diversispora epigaea]|uniref:Uncharacterized protein n=1 Tax=Diversispora epigaea TaxID=1348612 RepID=A0A397IVR3_9GLOM|nr:hypothetical protein Glove_186g137 [Diversispora epigaea]